MKNPHTQTRTEKPARASRSKIRVPQPLSVEIVRRRGRRGASDFRRDSRSACQSCPTRGRDGVSRRAPARRARGEDRRVRAVHRRAPSARPRGRGGGQGEDAAGDGSVGGARLERARGAGARAGGAAHDGGPRLAGVLPGGGGGHVAPFRGRRSGVSRGDDAGARRPGRGASTLVKSR